MHLSLKKYITSQSNQEYINISSINIKIICCDQCSKCDIDLTQFHYGSGVNKVHLLIEYLQFLTNKFIQGKQATRITANKNNKRKRNTSVRPQNTITL